MMVLAFSGDEQCRTFINSARDDLLPFRARELSRNRGVESAQGFNAQIEQLRRRVSFEFF